MGRASRMELSPGTRVTENVILVEPLGEGAMGSVWIAEHETLETQVAVKFIADVADARADVIERFRREATAAARIKSPHVVQTFDHGVMEDGTPYIVMELLEGESLQSRILEQGALSLEETAAVLTQVARALSDAHRRGIIHRDIKPHNIFLVDVPGELFAKVLDFGIAKRTDVSEDLTEPGTIVGTPHYVSRDLVMEGLHREVDEHVDMWSLGVVAYKCLTTALPFDGTSLNQIVGALAHGKFAPPSELRPSLLPHVDRWFKRALHPDKSARFADVDELAASFARLLDPEAAAEVEEDLRSGERPTSPSSPMALVPDEEGRRALADTEPAAITPPERVGTSTPALALVVAAGLAVGILATLWIAGDDEAPATATSALPPTPPSGTGPAPSAPPPPPSASGVPSASAVASASAAPSASASASAAPVDPPSRSPGKPGRGEIAIPSGPVWQGCVAEDPEACRADEQPLHRVWVPPYFIDRTEVRVVDYAACVVEGHCDDRRVHGTVRDERFLPSPRCNWRQKGRAKHPMNCVSYPQAAAFCGWKGKRLPTEAEWERAARSDRKTVFPWGDEMASCITTVMAEQGDNGCGRNSTWPVASKAKDLSSFGVVDLAGNVREWTGDWYDPRFYAVAPPTDEGGPEQGDRRVAKGGTWGTVAGRFLRISSREAIDPQARSVYLGFRCARDGEATEVD